MTAPEEYTPSNADEAIAYLEADDHNGDPLPCAVVCRIIKWIANNAPNRLEEACATEAAERCGCEECNGTGS